MTRYLLLIHFASKGARNIDKAARAQRVMACVRREFAEFETALTDENSVAICGLSAKPIDLLYRDLAIPGAPVDHVSLFDVSGQITTNHLHLAGFRDRTDFLVRRTSASPSEGQRPAPESGPSTTDEGE